MSLDARYDREQRYCACGCPWFVALRVQEFHVADDREGSEGLMPYGETMEQREVIARLPVAECLQCRTRYTALWDEVV